jgi:hypothetical protein
MGPLLSWVDRQQILKALKDLLGISPAYCPTGTVCVCTHTKTLRRSASIPKKINPSGHFHMIAAKLLRRTSINRIGEYRANPGSKAFKFWCIPYLLMKAKGRYSWSPFFSPPSPLINRTTSICPVHTLPSWFFSSRAFPIYSSRTLSASIPPPPPPSFTFVMP